MVALKTLTQYAAQSAVLGGALALVLAAMLKAQDFAAFRAALAAHGVVPEFVLGSAPSLIVAVEAAAGLGAIWGLMHARGRMWAFAIASLFLCFTIYAVALVLRPPVVPAPCGCGLGDALVENWTPVAARNAAAAVALFAAFLRLPRTIPVGPGDAATEHGSLRPSVPSRPFTQTKAARPRRR